MPPSAGFAPLLRAAGLLVFFTAFSILLSLPLSLSPGSRALDLGPDTRLFLWTISWDVHALVRHPLALFQANIFYPERTTLAYSEHLLGSALIGAPWLLATDNPVLAVNVVLLISCVTSGAGAYFLARQVGVGPAGALATGIIFSFAPPRFFRLGQIHLATVQWIPFCLGFLHAYARSGLRRHLWAASGFFTLQALSGGQSGLFLLLAAGGLFLYLGTVGTVRPGGKILRDLVPVSLLLLALNLPFLLPYFQVQRDSGLRRSLEEAGRWSPNAVSYVASPSHLHRALLSVFPGMRREILEKARAYLFPGFLTLGLAALALRRRGSGRSGAPAESRLAKIPSGGRAVFSPAWLASLDTGIVALALWSLLIQACGGIRWEMGSLTLSARTSARPLFVLGALLGLRLALAGRAPFSFMSHLRRWAGHTRRAAETRAGADASFYVLLGVFSLWASLGPRWGLYAALYRLVPGFDFIRVPSRLTLLTLLSLAVLAGLGTDRLLGPLKGNRRLLLSVVLLALLIAEFSAFPLEARPYSVTFPAIDRWLARQPGSFALVELPIPDPREEARSARLHSLYMLHSTAHWQKLVNGYSGFTPPGHDLLFRKLVNFPDEESLEALEVLGVGYAVFHRNLYRAVEWSEVEKRIEKWAGRLKLERVEDGDLAYSLTRVATSPPDR